jgi:hypothetical protein
MTSTRRTRRPRRGDAFWTDHVRTGSFDPKDPKSPARVAPTVAEAELLLEEARQAEIEQATALALQAEEDQCRRAGFERQAAADVDALEERLETEIATVRAADTPADRELRVLSRGFIHGSSPRGIKRIPPEDLIAARDDTAARLLELAREAELTYDRLSNSWSEFPLALDHPFVVRTDAVESAAWRAFVERVRVLAREASMTEPGDAARRSPEVWSRPSGPHIDLVQEFGCPR